MDIGNRLSGQGLFTGSGILMGRILDRGFACICDRLLQPKSCVLEDCLGPSLTVHGRSNGLGEPGEISMLIEGDAEEMFGG
jgi:hypothetical protein